KTETIDTRMKRKDGNQIEVELRLVPTTYEGEAAIQGVAIDVTEAKRLRESAERMKRLASLGEISAQIAHEVRNALGSIQLNLRYLSDHLPENQISRNGLENIQAGIDRIQDTIRAILNFAKPEPPSLQSLNAFNLLEQVLDSIEPEMKTGNITI